MRQGRPTKRLENRKQGNEFPTSRTLLLRNKKNCQLYINPKHTLNNGEAGKWLLHIHVSCCHQQNGVHATHVLKKRSIRYYCYSIPYHGTEQINCACIFGAKGREKNNNVGARDVVGIIQEWCDTSNHSDIIEEWIPGHNRYSYRSVKASTNTGTNYNRYIIYYKILTISNPRERNEFHLRCKSKVSISITHRHIYIYMYS